MRPGSALGAFNAAQQFVRGGKGAFSFVAENIFSIDQHGHVSRAAGFDFCGDAKFCFHGIAQANGRATNIPSKETALNFNIHFLLLRLMVEI